MLLRRIPQLQLFKLSLTRNLRGPILADLELQELGGVLDSEALLVGQVQEADEAEARRDVVHDGLRVHGLQVVHDARELERRLLLLLGRLRLCRRSGQSGAAGVL